MEALNQVLKAYPRARQTPSTSGDSEVDAVCRPARVWVAGEYDEAVFECDMISKALSENDLTVKRLGPRELHVSKYVRVIKHGTPCY